MEKKILNGKSEKLKKKKNFLIIGSGHKLSLEKSYIRAFKNLKFKNINYLFLDTGKLESFLLNIVYLIIFFTHF